MDKLQEAIILAAKLREDSWDESKLSYLLSMWDACDKAAESVGFDKRGTMPIYLLLDSGWNDALDWAHNR